LAATGAPSGAAALCNGTWLVCMSLPLSFHEPGLLAGRGVVLPIHTRPAAGPCPPPGGRGRRTVVLPGGPDPRMSGPPCGVREPHVRTV